VDRHLRTLDRDENHHLKQVPCPVRPDDEPTVWILSGVLGSKRMVNGVADGFCLAGLPKQ